MTTMSTLRQLLLLVPLPYSTNGLSVRQVKTKSPPSSSALAAVSQRQVAALDGAEWASLQLHLLRENQLTTPHRLSEVGTMTIVTASTREDDRIVGIQAPNDNNDETIQVDSSTQIYKSSMATIPKQISDQDAISTLLGALVGVHCALPKVLDVGGGSDSLVSGKVVVVGGSDYACFAAEALSSLGASVVQVSTGSPSHKSQHKNIETMSPAVGELDLGFADVIGEFDSLLDCMSDEARLRGGMQIRPSDKMEELISSGVVAELRKQHKCSCYVSTMSQAQRIVWNEGVLWGPNKASAHLKELSSLKNAQAIVPPREFGTTLQTLLDNGIVWKQKREGNGVLVRGWSLKDFWELSSWPRDATGTGDTRYGLPVLNVDSMLEERFSPNNRMIAEPPSIKGGSAKYQREEQEALREQAKQDASNPFVMTVHGVTGLQSDIIEAERDCLLFLSAPWCRTCRYISPQYTRMARESSKDIAFAKADATGNIGKALGKALEVDAVPAFVLFRQGQIFGSPLSVSRLPSKKLEQAIECLSSGMEWDDGLLDEQDE